MSSRETRVLHPDEVKFLCRNSDSDEADMEPNDSLLKQETEDKDEDIIQESIATKGCNSYSDETDMEPLGHGRLLERDTEDKDDDIIKESIAKKGKGKSKRVPKTIDNKIDELPHIDIPDKSLDNNKKKGKNNKQVLENEGMEVHDNPMLKEKIPSKEKKGKKKLLNEEDIAVPSKETDFAHEDSKPKKNRKGKVEPSQEDNSSENSENKLSKGKKGKQNYGEEHLSKNPEHNLNKNATGKIEETDVGINAEEEQIIHLETDNKPTKKSRAEKQIKTVYDENKDPEAGNKNNGTENEKNENKRSKRNVAKKNYNESVSKVKKNAKVLNPSENHFHEPQPDHIDDHTPVENETKKKTRGKKHTQAQNENKDINEAEKVKKTRVQKK